MKGKAKVLSLLLAVSLLLIAAVSVAAADYDLGGQTVKIAGHAAQGMQDYFTNGEGRGRVEMVEEEFNCKIEFVQVAWEDAMDTILTSSLAGDPVGDLLFINNRWLPTLAREGALLPLDDVLDEDYYNSLPGAHKYMRDLYSSYQGKAYGISVNGSYPRNMDIGSGQGWIYNKEMFDEAGLPYPNQLQQSGEWTWEKMKEFAIKLTKDKDGDGKIDQWGVGARLDPWPIAQELFAYANGGGIMKFEDGKAVYAMNDPQAIEALELWRELVHEHNVVMVGDKYDIRKEFNKGNVAQFRLDLYALPDHANEVNFDFGWAFIPKGPQAEDYVNPVWGFDMFALPVTCENPEAMVEIVNMLFETTADYRDIDRYEEEFVEFFMPHVRDRESLQTIKDMLSKAILWNNIPGLDGNEEFRLGLVEAVMGEKSPKSVMDSFEPMVQSLLDEAYNK